MPLTATHRASAIALSACTAFPALAQTAAEVAQEDRIRTLEQQLADQERRLGDLRQTLEREQASVRNMRRAVGEHSLSGARGGASARSGANVNANANSGAVAPAPGNAQTAAMADAPLTVGQAADTEGRLPAVAPIFEQPGVLTGRGNVTLEPSLQYSYSTNNRVALLGYTIIPALVVGLIDVREVRRNTATAALTGRFGLSNRWEVEARVPYLYRSDSTVSREAGGGAATDSVFSANGHALGDIELATRYQFNTGSADMPFFVGGLRFKSRTGRDPFEVVTDCMTRCVGNASGTGLPLALPTGSGFYSLQPSLTWLLPSDPAVLFGSFSYLHNFKRNVSRTVLNGEVEPLGSVEPGDAIGVNVGMGLSINDRSSFSVGYDHQSVGPTKQNGERVPASVRTELSTLVFGYSYRLTPSRNLSFSIGAGLTQDTPDVTLTVRMPMTF